MMYFANLRKWWYTFYLFVGVERKKRKLRTRFREMKIEDYSKCWMFSAFHNPTRIRVILGFLISPLKSWNRKCLKVFEKEKGKVRNSLSWTQDCQFNHRIKYSSHPPQPEMAQSNHVPSCKASKRLIGLFKPPSENLRWHHLQALHRNVIHVKRKSTGWNSSLLITKCSTSLASDATIARAHSRYMPSCKECLTTHL